MPALARSTTRSSMRPRRSPVEHVLLPFVAAVIGVLLPHGPTALAQEHNIRLTLGGDAPFVLACTLVPQERIETHEGVPPMELRFAREGVDCDIRTTGSGRLTVDVRGPGGSRIRTAGPGSRLAQSLR